MSAGVYGLNGPQRYAKEGIQGLEAKFNQLLETAKQAESTESKKSAFEEVFQFAKKNSSEIQSPHLINFFYAYAMNCYTENTTEGWLNAAGMMDLSALLQLRQKRELDSGIPFSLDRYDSLDKLVNDKRSDLSTLTSTGQPLFALDNVLRRFEKGSQDRQQLSDTYKYMSQALLANYALKLQSREFLTNVSNLAKQLIEDPEDLKDFEEYSGKVLAYIFSQEKTKATPAVVALQMGSSSAALPASSPAPLVQSHKVEALKPARSNDEMEEEGDWTFVTSGQEPIPEHWLWSSSIWSSVSTLATSYLRGPAPE